MREAWLRRLCQASEMDVVKKLQGGIEVLSVVIDGALEGKTLALLDKPMATPDYMSHDSDGANGG